MKWINLFSTECGVKGESLPATACFALHKDREDCPHKNINAGAARLVDSTYPLPGGGPSGGFLLEISAGS